MASTRARAAPSAAKVRWMSPVPSALCAPTASTLYVAHYDMDRSTPASRAVFLEKVKKKLAAF